MLDAVCRLLLLALLMALGCRTDGSSELASGPRRVEFAPGDITEFNPAHFEGPFTVAGDWDLDPKAMQSHYDGLEVAQFGSLNLSLEPGVPFVSRATGKRKYIRELHYMLGSGQVGIRPIPIVDRPGPPDSSDPDYPQPNSKYWKDYPPLAKAADGTPVRGSEALDELLRREYGFAADDAKAPLFALYGLTHPELYDLDFSLLADLHFLKTENSITHLGAYIGAGQTRNSPASYGAMRWEILHQARQKPLGRLESRGYPAHIYVVRPRIPGVDTRSFLHNILITLRLLNELNDGPSFPIDYKSDWVQAINLEETLAFYRAWIDPEWKRDPRDDKPYLQKIKEDPLYQSYCSEHLTIVLNVAVNLVQNEQGYKDLWGASDGGKLWQLAKRRYENRERLVTIGNGVYMTQELGPNANSKFPEIDSRRLTPLWKTLGIRNPVREKTPFKGLIYPLVTNADLVAAMIEQYANWVDVGPVLATGVLFHFLPEAMRRTGISQADYLQFAIKFATKMIKHDASAQAFADSGDIDKAYLAYLDQLEQGDPATQRPGLRTIFATLESAIPGGTETALQNILTNLKSRTTLAWIKKNHGKDLNKEAWPAFLADAKEDMEAARAVDTAIPQGKVIETPDGQGGVQIEKNIKYYTPPAVIHRMATGLYPYADGFIEIKAVATAFDASELRRGTGPFRQYQLP